MQSGSLRAALALVMALWSVPGAEAAGTVPLALSVQTDHSGNIASGCLLNFFIAGTVATPQNAYQDFGLTQPLPNPVQCDQGGRLPMFWLADGLIHLRLTDSGGVVIVDTTMQVLGPSSGGGGGGGTVDPTTIASTGDEKTRYDNTTISGWVRENGLTIGNVTSGASERANADTQNLFVYLYNKDPNLVVVGGRTGNALNDYNASKQLTLPDMRGRAAVALADMGNSASSVLTSTYCSSPTTLGFSCGGQSATLGITNLPTFSVSGTLAASVSGQTNVAVLQANGGSGGVGAASSGVSIFGIVGNASLGLAGVSASGSATGSLFSSGTADTPFGVVMPIMLRTFYVKL